MCLCCQTSFGVSDIKLWYLVRGLPPEGQVYHFIFQATCSAEERKPRHGWPSVETNSGTFYKEHVGSYMEEPI